MHLTKHSNANRMEKTCSGQCQHVAMHFDRKSVGRVTFPMMSSASRKGETGFSCGMSNGL
eukprot:3702572-Rhodomonas_salina.2